MSSAGTPSAVFVGLCTLDIIQLVDHVPTGNEKLTARRQTVAAGGPATNAAATFAHLGGRATLLTGVGRHPLTAGIRSDLDELKVRLVDQAASRTAPPSVSSIMVTAATGERAVVSTNATTDRLTAPEDLDALVREADAVQVDGHHPHLALAALTAARAAGRPTVLDAGSWKPGTERLLPLLDVVACSADFRPPGTDGPDGASTFLRDHGVPWVAVTRGAGPVRWWAPDAAGEVPAPAVTVVDTLGAGDVFHGALTYGLSALAGEPLDAGRFVRLLGHAARIASTACASFGTRAWMSDPEPVR
jgi:sugar/nucleoside kinase (ribokinase family)